MTGRRLAILAVLLFALGLTLALSRSPGPVAVDSPPPSSSEATSASDRTAPTATRPEERTAETSAVEPAAEEPAADSPNARAALALIGGRSPHDLALLADVERSRGSTEATGAALELLRRRDAGASPALLRELIADHLSRPLPLRVAADRWLATELGLSHPADPSASRGRGHPLGRFAARAPR